MSEILYAKSAHEGVVYVFDEKGSITAETEDGRRVCHYDYFSVEPCLESPTYRVFLSGSCLARFPNCVGHLVCEEHARDVREGRAEFSLLRIESI